MRLIPLHKERWRGRLQQLLEFVYFTHEKEEEEIIGLANKINPLKGHPRCHGDKESSSIDDDVGVV